MLERTQKKWRTRIKRFLVMLRWCLATQPAAIKQQADLVNGGSCPHTVLVVACFLPAVQSQNVREDVEERIVN